MDVVDDRLNALRALRLFEGKEGEFWLTYAEKSCRLLAAERVVLLRRSERGWSPFVFWPLGTVRSGVVDPALMENLAGQTLQSSIVYYFPQSANETGNPDLLLTFRLQCATEDGEMLALFFRASGSEIDRTGDQLMRELLFDIPASYKMSRTDRLLLHERHGMPDPLDVMLSMNEQSRFVGAAMALCNELSYRFNCSRVSLGWKEGEYVRLQVLSHTEKFDRKMGVVQALEMVMEECLDQDEELLVPEDAGSSSVVREHRNFAVHQGVAAMLSLPLRLEQKVVAVLSCEREKSFSSEEVRALRIICDQVSRRLSELKRHDRWFGAEAVDALVRWGGSVFGTDHTVNKMYGGAVTLFLAFLLFGTLDYRIEAPFILRTKDLALLSAPFDGYIERVSRKPGDLVRAGHSLLLLDIRQLLLEQSRSFAEVQRYAQDEKKAMAQNTLAEMKVAEALKRQADSRLQMIQYNLDHAEIKAPFTGVVVEGDLEKLLGAPVRKGDVLLKVAKLEDLYVEMKVPERDIQELTVGQRGEVAFISQPGRKFKVLIERIEPMAVTDQKGSVFLVLGRIMEVRQGWWRPGMSGLAKLSVGRRPIIWILLHRTIDFFSMKLWW
ncbi:MAG: efflux RND transporter periplasmic adaptor subunit [Chlorobium sp.]